MQTEITSQWRGIHHIALSTPDLDATRHFYGEIVGMPISDVFPSKHGRGRHCFVFVTPEQTTTWGMHFFERPTGEGGALLHLCFSLADQAAADALHERLRSNGISTTVIPELGGNFTFTDNNGVMLEITWLKPS
jgi:catechol 2,3-dioxygenase-like lactoylglutathione lyase family enzyme